ncbi:MAG: transketolase, partial [Phaeodactylibacter sp.]|nr:transketolase [Phaeodactylibacter sp.]
ETVNAAAVLRVPLAISVWDDGYGISVPIEYQTAKSSISDALAGFQIEDDGRTGIEIYTAKAWDYPTLVQLYAEAIGKVRATHTPALIHIKEATQPQGHSTSGSHERYKTKERLKWEKDKDCLLLMAEWMINEGLATQDELDAIRKEAKSYVKQCRDRAWKAFNAPARESLRQLQAIYALIPSDGGEADAVRKELKSLMNPLISELAQNARRMYYLLMGSGHAAEQELANWIDKANQTANRRYHTHLHSSSPRSALKVPAVPADYAENPPLKNGYEILNAFFDVALGRQPEIFAFGEDVGKIGDVNQGFAGMQSKYGEERVFDTGIREATIMGQAIGMAMRGLRPIAEIQYLDYLIYGLQPLMDDLATLRYRSNGQQHAPAIIRTRGHRLEGIWHAGSPLGMVVNSLRGIYVCVPRDMTRAAGMYNTLLQSDDPGLVVECLNGYRLKEPAPENIGEFTIPLGVPEVLHPGSDLTLVTYGSCVRVALAGIELLKQHGISVELIDVQTLLPFDLEHQIVESLKKTSRVLFMDEDLPGGATAFMMREVLEKQGGYRYLDSAPATLTAKEHRPPYGSDGDYFSKPQPEDVFEAVYKIMQEANPKRFPGKLA